MGEYEPKDSRNVTLNPHRAPGEPPRTGPREGETRQERTELDEDGRGERAEDAVAQAEAESAAEQRERGMDRDTEELDARYREGRERFDRND